jgi:hypothetical protein
MSKVSRRERGVAKHQSKSNVNELYEIHDLPESKPKKVTKARSQLKGQKPLSTSTSKKGSLFPKEVDSRTFFIPENQQDFTNISKLPTHTKSSQITTSIPQTKTQIRTTNSKGIQSPLIKTPNIIVNISEDQIKQNKKNISPNNNNNGTGAIPLPRPLNKPTSSNPITKQTINLRVRPKSASAARRPNPKPGQWNCQTECGDWNLLRMNSDAQRWTKVQTSETEKETKTFHRTAHALSQRKPSIPGQVCYGTNNQGVKLPRRPQTASNGRENRPIATSLSDKPSNELHRDEYGGWQGSTLLSDDRIGYDRRFRYPQKFAVADVAAVNNYQPQGQDLAKPAWIHTTSSSNFANKVS